VVVVIYGIFDKDKISNHRKVSWLLIMLEGLLWIPKQLLMLV